MIRNLVFLSSDIETILICTSLQYEDIVWVVGLGNPRGFENPFLLSFGVLWFRWHNYWANRTAVEHGWTSEDDLVRFDERIFNQARKMVVGSYQVMYRYLNRYICEPGQNK